MESPATGLQLPSTSLELPITGLHPPVTAMQLAIASLYPAIPCSRIADSIPVIAEFRAVPASFRAVDGECSTGIAAQNTPPGKRPAAIPNSTFPTHLGMNGTLRRSDAPTLRRSDCDGGDVISVLEGHRIHRARMERKRM
jgi:hypothetical protein